MQTKDGDTYLIIYRVFPLSQEDDFICLVFKSPQFHGVFFVQKWVSPIAVIADAVIAFGFNMIAIAFAYVITRKSGFVKNNLTNVVIRFTKIENDALHFLALT